LSENLRHLSRQPGTDVAFGEQSKLRATTDAGSLLGKSSTVIGLSVERRTPIITDPHVRGSSVGQLLASGSYWFPVRQDLDTLLSKIDSRIISEMIVIKGPYSARYGPGFNFIDVQLLPSPRYANGFESHCSTSIEYKTNGAQWYGRETVWGGNDTYGFRVGYGHRTGNDYRAGSGIEIPASYNSRDFDVALGFDLSETSSLEFSYLRLDQTGVEIAGQVFDLDYLVTDAFALTYAQRSDGYYDLLVLEGWYNQSRLGGNAQRSGKRRQMPILDANSFFGVVDASNASTGFSLELNWGDEGEFQRSVGVDLRHLNQGLNEYDRAGAPPPGWPPLIFPLNTFINFPIPDAHSTNPGLFAEGELPLTSRLTVRGGGRLDWVHNDAEATVPGTLASRVGATEEDALGGSFDQNFNLGSGFLTAEYEVSDAWTMAGGAGYAMRPPTMTEMYAVAPFMAVLPQFAFTSPFGNPNLRSEKRTQVDLGARADYGCFRGGINAYYAWIEDYITLDYVTPPIGFVYVWTNSPRAELTGFELYGEQDLGSYTTLFGTMSYREGTDRTRAANGFFPGLPRSSSPVGTTLATGSEEPLPVIYPLDSRMGVHLHGLDQRWGVELATRIVASQGRVATSLGELPTPGFYTFDIRGFWQATEHLFVFAGVENLTDQNYLEHFDSRIFVNPVFQPGANFYFGTELVR
jgi:outer membrane receptor protein involved in Fe transport